MSIPPLSASLYSSLLSGQSTAAGTSGNSATNANGISSQVLAAVEQSLATGSGSSSLLQDVVSLSSQAQGGTSATPLTYNAQGLLQQVQQEMMLNDPLLQSDSSGGSTGGSLLQSVLARAGLSSQGTTSSATSSSTSSTTTDSTSLSAQWAQLLQQNPSLATVLVQNAADQGAISMFGS